MQATGQQRAAIEAEGNVLVMAGAGTGKTSTLVARVVERLSREAGRIRADRVLMVTFTEAAAAEMRQRLRERLDECGLGMADQVARLDLASIGTLHGFCLQMLREHGVELGLEPQLTVLDEAESGRLARWAWSRWVESQVEGGDAGEALRAWVGAGFDGDLEAVWRTVWEIHRYAQTLADPDLWLESQAAMWSEESPVLWRRWMEDGLREWVAGWVARFRVEAGNRLVEARLRRLEEGVPVEGASREDWWTALVENPGEYTPRRKTEERRPLATFFEEVDFLHSLDSAGGDPLREDWEACRGWMAALVGAVRAFAAAFRAEKRSRGGVDFSDLEQLALDLLVRRPGGAAAWCRDRYDLVVVDECQDVNAAQDAILRAVSREGEGANRFLVGDVKQSIYRFRLADPRLFQEVARRWNVPGGEGQVIPLTGNFRSAESILKFVNRVCGRLFRSEVGGVEYGPDAHLVFGESSGRDPLKTSADPGPRVEWHVRVNGGESESEESGDAGGGKETVAAVEARLIARRLREMHEAGTPVWDRKLGSFRPVTWSDMAVLLRGLKGKVSDFSREFQRAGVPLAARQAGFFEIPAVADLRNVLRILDNPLQDIPLVGVLRSPLVGLSDPNALALIRMSAVGERHWWTLLQRFANGACAAEGGDAESGALWDMARGKAAVFLERHRSWRQTAVRSGAAAALEAVLDDTGYEVWAAGRPDRGETLANVRRFLEMARRFDAGSRGGLYRFLTWLDGEESADTVEAAAGRPEAAVQLMTVHRSKGLEFPVVVVAGLGSRFQMMDLTASRVIRDEVHGLCPLVTRWDGRRYPSATMWMAQRRQRRELLGEELRLLYVALTRAADHLLLFGTARTTALEERWPEVAAGLRVSEAPMSAACVADAGTALDWLGPILMAARSGPDPAVDAGISEGFSWQFWRGAVAPSTEVEGVPVRCVPVEPAVRAAYPHVGATLEPSKVTATGLRRRMAEDSDGLDVGQRAFGIAHGASDPRDGSAVDRGMAHHAFFEHADPDVASTESGVLMEAQRLLRAGWMTEEEVGRVEVAAVWRFWDSGLGRDIRSRRAGMQREVAFTVRLTAADLRLLGFRVAPDLEPDEFVVGQGVVDLAVIDEAGIWIVDFKTDRVLPGEPTRLKAAAYRPQLAVYGLALARIFGRPVMGRWLHFLATGETVAV